MLIEAAWGVVAAAAGVTAWAVRGKSATLLAPSVYRGPKDQPAIALTFDDGPSEATPQLLELLDQHQARATFFMIGKHVERLPEIARLILARGHEAGNHTYSHSPLYLRHPQFIRDELALAQEVIEKATGRKALWFRPPYGARWFGLRQAQAELGLMGVMWTAIARDWKLDAAGIYDRMRRALANGAILCLHDGRELEVKPNISATVEAVRRLLPEIQRAGYRMVSLSELLCRKSGPGAPSV